MSCHCGESGYYDCDELREMVEARKKERDGASQSARKWKDTYKTTENLRREVGEKLDTVRAELQAAQQRFTALESYMQDLAEHECDYGDNCPKFGSRHGQCVGCKAREALAKVGSKVRSYDDE